MYSSQGYSQALSTSQTAVPGDPQPPTSLAPYLFPPRYIISGQADVSVPDAKLNDAALAAGVGVGYESPQAMINFFVRKGSKDQIGATQAEDGTITSGDRSAFGASVLDPMSASYSFSLSAAYYPDRWWMKRQSNLLPHFGIRGYMMASSIQWNYAMEGVSPSMRSVQAAPTGAGLCPSVYSFTTLNNGMHSMVYAHACVMARYIGGDFAILPAAEREAIFQTTRKMFYGPEFEFGVHIGSLAVSVRTFWLPYEVGGLSNFRFIPTISAFAPLEFPIKRKGE